MLVIGAERGERRQGRLPVEDWGVPQALSRENLNRSGVEDDEAVTAGLSEEGTEVRDERAERLPRILTPCVWMCFKHALIIMTKQERGLAYINKWKEHKEWIRDRKKRGRREPVGSKVKSRWLITHFLCLRTKTFFTKKAVFNTSHAYVSLRDLNIKRQEDSWKAAVDNALDLSGECRMVIKRCMRVFEKNIDKRATNLNMYCVWKHKWKQ